jgi:hypothetical protein
MLSSPGAASSAHSHASSSSTLPAHVTAPLTPGSVARSTRPARHRTQRSIDAAASREGDALHAPESSTAAARSAAHDERAAHAAVSAATEAHLHAARSTLWQAGWQLAPPPQPPRQLSRSVSPHQASAERARPLSSGIQGEATEAPPPPRPRNPPPAHLLQRVAVQHHHAAPSSPPAGSPRSRYTYASTAHSSLPSPQSPPLADLLHAFPAGPGSAFETPRPAPSPPSRQTPSPQELRLAPALPVRERVPAAGVGQSPTRPYAHVSATMSRPPRTVPRPQPPTLSSAWSQTPPRGASPPHSAPPARGLRRLFLPDEAASAGRTARRLRLRLSADLAPTSRVPTAERGTPARAAVSSPLRASQASPSSKSPAVKLALARARALSGGRAEHRTAAAPAAAIQPAMPSSERHIPPSTPPRRAPQTNISPGSNLNFSRPLPPLPDLSTPPRGDPPALPHAHRGFLASLEQRKARERKDRLHAWSIEVSSGGVPVSGACQEAICGG